MKAKLQVLLLCLLSAGMVFGQGYKGSLQVTVTTPDGEALPGAVALLTEETFSRSFVTNEDGLARFTGLEPGRYTLRVSFSGFNTIVRPNISIETGSNVKLDVAMSPSSTQEEMVVTAETPLMDTTKVGTSTVLTEEELNQVPQARDPWSVLSTIPAVQTDRYNIGGSEAGQQSNFAGKGDDGDNASWTIDGVEFTDPGAQGGSASYLDFSSFQQIGVSTAGADVSQRAAGQALNFVTKKGSNSHSGSMRLLFADNNFQSSNNENAFRKNGTQFAGNSINETFEKSFEIGGPLVKDKLWYWGAFSQNSIDIGLITGQSDKTILENTSFKLHGDITDTTRFNLFYTNGDKIKNGRGAAVSRPTNTTWNQEGPTPIYKAEISQLVGQNTELTLLFGRVDGKFSLSPIGSEDNQLNLDLNTGIWADTTFFYYSTVRPTRQYEIKGNTFLSTGSADHELKYGFSYRDAEVSSLSRAGNDALYTLSYGAGNGGFVYFYRGTSTATALEATSLYVNDTITFGNWTINAGLRFDDQSGNNIESFAPGSPASEGLLPSLQINAQDTPFSHETIAPRIGATYVFGDEGQYLFRGSISRYYDNLTTGDMTDTNPGGSIWAMYFWNDLNGDNIFTADERGDHLAQNFSDPLDQSSISKIDPNLEAPQTDEIVLGFEYSISPEFTLGATFTMRERSDELWRPLDGISRSDYVLGNTVTLDGSQTIDGTSHSIPVYVLTDEASARNPNRATILTNRPDYSEDYTGLELTATKRLSDRWMLRGNLVFQEWTRNVGAGAIQNPTQLWGGMNEDGGTVAVQSAGSGTRDNIFFGSSTWQGNVNGLYQLPWDLTVSANINFREGFAQPQGYRTSPMSNADTSNRRYILAVGGVDSMRNDDVVNVDFKLTKNFTMGNTKVDLGMEVFNLFNEDTVLAENLRLDQTSTFGETREIISPRIMRFSATVNF